MNYELAGSFTASSAGDGAWRLSGGLSASAPSGVTNAVQILLRGVSASAAQLFAGTPRIQRVVLEWRRDVVIVTLTLTSGIATVTARSALVHEPQSDLYRCLPLAEFDARARGFWKRIFGLMRIPGGHFLLGMMTRRARRSR